MRVIVSNDHQQENMCTYMQAPGRDSPHLSGSGSLRSVGVARVCAPKHPCLGERERERDYTWDEALLHVQHCTLHRDTRVLPCAVLYPSELCLHAGADATGAGLVPNRAATAIGSWGARHGATAASRPPATPALPTMTAEEQTEGPVGCVQAVLKGERLPALVPPITLDRWGPAAREACRCRGYRERGCRSDARSLASPSTKDRRGSPGQG